MKKDLRKVAYRLGFLVISLLFITQAYAQVSVSGIISSALDDQSLPGASVMEKGTSNGTVTDLDGKFTLEVASEDATIVISYVGYLQEELAVKGMSSIEVSLIQDLMSLDAVSVVAYSTKTKTEISSAVVSLAAEDINQVTVNNVEDMLIGKVAGVHVQSASGQPGGDSEIRIRGVGSVFSNQDPLVVVDGVIGGAYNPNDIESVSVLKDAGATGLYGSAAASGVILITTKSGKKGTSEIRASIKKGIKQPEFGNFEMMNSQGLYDYHEQIYSPSVFPIARPDSLLNSDYDWVNNTYEQADIMSVYVSASGATEKTNYFFSVDYLDDQGTLRGTSYDRFSIRSNVRHQLYKRLNIGSNFILNSTSGTYSHWNMAEGVFRLQPWDMPYTTDGELVYDVAAAGWISNVVSNPYHSEQYNTLRDGGIDGTATFTLDLDILDWLKLDSYTTLSGGYGKYEEIYPRASYEGGAGGGNGSMTNSIYFDKSFGNTTLLKFINSFGIHNIDGLVGGEIGKYVSEREYGGTGKGFLTGQEVLVTTGQMGTPTGTIVESSGVSFLSQLNYNLNKKYFATISYRIDGNSKFAPNNKYASFLTYSASWLMSEEEFIKTIDPINYLKIRASYGEVGNSAFPDDNYYPYFPAFQKESVYNGGSAYYPYEPGNYNMTWETSKPLNVGLDMGFLKRIEVNFDFYTTKTEDLLFQDPLPASQGYSYQWQNVGSIENTGYELAINAFAIKTKEITWHINFNVASNNNKLTALTAKEGITEQVINGGSVSQILTVDGGAFDWYMPKWLGVDPDNGQPLWEDIIYDADGNEIGREATSDYNLAKEDNQIMGSPFPEFTGGFGTYLSYKGLSVNVAFAFQQGNKIYHQSRQELDNDGENNNVNSMKLQDGWSRWENPGDNATHPEPIYGGNNQSNEYSSRYLEDGSYLRLRNLTIAYELPKNIVEKVKLNSMRISLSMDNVKTWTKYSGMDPDVPLYKSSWQLPGQQSFKYPISKQYLLGLEISF